MMYPDVNDNSTGPYGSTRLPYEEQTDSYTHTPVVPSTPQRIGPPPKQPARGLRTGAIIMLTVVIALVFGVGLFAGWQFGRSSTLVVD